MAMRERWMRFLEVESRVVWSAPADMRVSAAEVRPVRKARAKGERDVAAEGKLIEAGKMESRYLRTGRDLSLSARDRTAAWRERLPWRCQCCQSTWRE